jgi:hypothetical protein
VALLNQGMKTNFALDKFCKKSERVRQLEKRLAALEGKG